ncbi:MAG: fructose-1,6-bisphosphatase [Ruminococcus sp.]|nr:fructose-1,6-bisphosphatase [Ruminococcus sp.]
MTDERKKYLKLLSEKYPTERSLVREIINLTAILNLPKGTEHFMSDLHGEYEAFCHILNNCSGVIREKVRLLFGDTLSHEERKELCTLIYYPKEKLTLLRHCGRTDESFYSVTINRLLKLAASLSSKYTRSKVRKAMPDDYAYIIDELLHAQEDEDDNQVRYHNIILNTIIDIDPEDFVISLSSLIKRLAVDHLHIVGDIFDRGESADKIVDLLMGYHSLDIEWGNHDILWMGAACGSEACIANVVRNAIKYNTITTLESGYGISLRSLALFAGKLYPDMQPMKAALKAISVIQFKLEGEVIKRNPDYRMNDRVLLDKINFENSTVESEGETYSLNDTDLPTVNPENPCELTDEEKYVITGLKNSFINSARLKKHISFLYEKGGMYRIYNSNLLYHGCVPLKDDGTPDEIEFFGQKLSSKSLFDFSEKKARYAFFGRHRTQNDIDFMWYLWCGRKSPLCGRNIKTFERFFIDDPASHYEEKNPYYKYYETKETCLMILSGFGLNTSVSHIINGHTPVRTVKGELPIRADGRLLVIDGGFCSDYHEKTGIAGYTLIYNSHGLRLKAHKPFENVDKAINSNKDIHSDSEIVETESSRMMVADTDNGERIESEIKDLTELLRIYRKGI